MLNQDKPYGILSLALKFIAYLFKARTIHAAHSPFLFDFFKQVLQNSKSNILPEVEQCRNALIASNQEIVVQDFGAGSRLQNSTLKKVSNIAKSALLPLKYRRLMAQIIAHYRFKNALELGTSLGITTAYMAKNMQNKGFVYSIEADPSIHNLAIQQWNTLKIKNIQSFQGTFEALLPEVLILEESFDFVYIDGDHRYQSTLDNFNKILPKLSEKSVVIFDDIHWSKGMEAAWNKIYRLKQVTLSLDLFRFGLVFLNKDLQKEHYIIKY